MKSKYNYVFYPFVLIAVMIIFSGCKRTVDNKADNYPNNETELVEMTKEVETEPALEPYMDLVTEPETETETETEPPTEPPTVPPTEPPTVPPTVPPTEPPTVPPTEAPLVNPETGLVVPDYIYTLSSVVRSADYGAGGSRDEHNRPYAVLSLQNEYGDAHNTVFIGENSKIIYLTFVEDTEYRDANGVRKTEKLLNILKENDIKATFFCTGDYIRRNADLCMRMISEGHSIGGHGYSHISGGTARYPVSFQYIDAYQMKQQVRETLGIELKLYRPDYECFSHQSLAILNEMGLKTVMQSFAYRDYVLNEHPDNETTLNMFKQSLHYGEIMGLHPLCDNNIEILQDFINYAREQGYSFGVIS